MNLGSIEQSPNRWLAHSPMTEPAALAALVARLPNEVAALNRVVQGLLVHCDWLEQYDEVAAFGTVSRSTLPVEQRLAALIERDGRALDEGRVPARREIGTCRDFALLLCAFLRTKNIPARLRCGFASYFGEDWEDHWVCEYWDSRGAGWCLSDAQLDSVIAAACGVTFDTSDVPRHMFLTAGEAWLRCRTGSDDPQRYGQGSIRGVWFMMVNAARDALAINNRETSAWDRWREARPELRSVSPEKLAAIDELARNPATAMVALEPPWFSNTA